jgi:hypothetical protein
MSFRIEPVLSKRYESSLTSHDFFGIPSNMALPLKTHSFQP